MASPIITPLPVPTDTSYRPVSKLAVVGLLLSIPSVFLFLSSNLVWIFFLFTLPAAVISIVALRSIRTSEGALAGEAVALTAIVISIACGLGWVTKEVVTKVVTEMEAKSVVEEWLENLRTNRPGAAFLLTQAPKQRSITFNPEEHVKLRRHFPDAQQTSLFDNFLADPFYGQLLRYGDVMELDYVGIVEHQAKDESLSYRFKYNLKTPVAEGSCILFCRSEDTQNEQGVRREWIVSVDRNGTVLRTTRYGEELGDAIRRAQDAVEKFLFAIANDNQGVIDQYLTADKGRQGRFDVVRGYLRNNVEEGGVLMALQKPIRLRSEKREGSAWRLTFDCTTSVQRERMIDFSITAVSDPSDRQKWTLMNCQFLGTRRMITAEDDPNSPKMFRADPGSK